MMSTLHAPDVRAWPADTKVLTGDADPRESAVVRTTPRRRLRVQDAPVPRRKKGGDAVSQPGMSVVETNCCHFTCFSIICPYVAKCII